MPRGCHSRLPRNGLPTLRCPLPIRDRAAVICRTIYGSRVLARPRRSVDPRSLRPQLQIPERTHCRRDGTADRKNGRRERTTLSHRALVVVPSEKGWHWWETTWRDDRTEPVGGWQPLDASFGADSVRTVVESLDFAQFDGLYRRSGGEWTPFLACWFAVEHWIAAPVPDPRGDGAVVAIRSSRDASALRSWFRAAKGATADAVRAGELSRTAARRRLLERLQRRARDRELIVGTDPRE